MISHESGVASASGFSDTRYDSLRDSCGSYQRERDMKHKNINDECDESVTHTSSVKTANNDSEETVESFTRHAIAHNDRFPIHHLLALLTY